MSRIFTIGHAPFDTVAQLIEPLLPRVVTVVIDVRSRSDSTDKPYSNELIYARFNRSVLEAALNRECIYYQYLGDALSDRPDAANCYEGNKATYEKIAATAAFEKGIAQIVETAQRQRVVLLGVEADPLNCPRAILVCQHLKPYGLDIQHILEDNFLESHRHLEDRMLLSQGLIDECELLEDEPQISLLAQAWRERQVAEAYDLWGSAIAYKGKRPHHASDCTTPPFN
ncbi:MAG: DUF488 domain-containing protein [Cyanobacteria bacterium J06598_1]